MNLFFINILLAITWLGLTQDWGEGNFITGYIVGFLVIAFVGKGIKQIGNQKYPQRFTTAVWFIFYFLYCLVESSIKVFIDSLLPKNKMKIAPGIIKVPLSLKTDMGILTFANCITLTPGTMTMEISSDKKFIYVHHMYLSENIEHSIKELKQSFEVPIMEIME